MKKDNLVMKETLTVRERAAMTMDIVDSYFNKNEETGEVVYTPYFRDMAELIAFVTYFIEGISFDENENLYEAIMNDDDVMYFYHEYLNMHVLRDKINNDVYDIVEFKKQQIIHNNKSSLDSLLDTINEVVKKLDDSLNIKEIMPLIPKLTSMKDLDEKALVDAMIASRVIKPQDYKKKSPTKAMKDLIVNGTIAGSTISGGTVDGNTITGNIESPLKEVK